MAVLTTQNMIRILFLLLAVLVMSCDSHTYWEEGKYQVFTFDDKPISLYLDLGNGAFARKIEHVVAVGSNNVYVAAETEGSHYYFIKKSEDEFDSKDAIYGPFTKQEFEKQKEKLKLPEFRWRYGS